MVGNAAAKERLALPAVANAKPTNRTEADFRVVMISPLTLNTSSHEAVKRRDFYF
jgi:hypothetical protein